MIPVPESELELYDLENESDDTYKDLVQNEMKRSGIEGALHILFPGIYFPEFSFIDSYRQFSLTFIV